MGMGPITWACLLLTAHQTPVQEIHFNARDMRIPIRIVEEKRARLRALSLLVSHDRGATWIPGPEVPPTAKDFTYHASEDGPYWFIVQEAYTNGQHNPPDPLRARPNQCLLVDTVKPQVDVAAEHLPSGEVQVRWKVNEQSPVERSIRVHYHTDAMRPDQWTPLPLEASLQGEKRFNPGSNVREVVVRVQVEDRATNVGEGQARVSLTAAVGSNPGNGADPAIGVIPTMRAEQASVPGQLASRQGTRSTDPPPPQGLPMPGAPASMPSPDEMNPAMRAPAAPASGSPPSAVGSSAPAPLDRSPLASSGAAPTETPNGALPPLKIVKNREVRLDFEVAKVGPSGLGNADVYVTLNEGASWSKLPGDVPLILAPGIEPHGPGPVRGSVGVQLSQEKVIYGFIVAVKSKAGLARPKPKDGEPPQVRVELDASAPQAQLFGPVPDANQPNSLILSWSAVDRNLAADAITLEWSEHKEGPWTLIADKLANTPASGTLPPQVTGSYVWQLPASMPSRVFLKLTVRDNAGNVAVAQADKPQLIDLSVPETRSVVVSPGGR